VKADSSAVKKRDSRTGFRHPNSESLLQKISRRGGRGLSKQPSWTPDAGSAFRSIPARYRGPARGGRAAGRAVARPFAMPGGFIGVDIFFAISGFLITGIIVRELLSGRFSLLQFYRRRIRRIFPDRCACAVLALGWLWMLPVA
jgi:hypothetical protein